MQQPDLRPIVDARAAIAFDLVRLLSRETADTYGFYDGATFAGSRLSTQMFWRIASTSA